jgi:hypothetical protein
MQFGWWCLLLVTFAACSSSVSAVPLTAGASRSVEPATTKASSVVASSAPANPSSAPVATTAMPRTPAADFVPTNPDTFKDCYRLLEAVMPFAKQTLTRYHELYPFGATLDSSGQGALTAASTGDEHPDSRTLIDYLRKGYQDGAKSGKLRATALVFDIATVPPGATEKTDAIAVMLDHRDGYSVIFIFPYSFSPDGEIHIGEMFSRDGANDIFPR